MKPLLLSLALMTLAACGYVGEPLPPASLFPAPVTDLRVVQKGEFLEASFTLPTATLEGFPITQRGAIEVRVGRVVLTPPEPPAKDPVFNQEGWSGGTRPYPAEWPADRPSASIRVPVADWAGQDVVIGVRLANPKGRFGGYSNLVSSRVVAPVPAPANIRLTELPEGIRLTWDGTRDGVRYRIQKQEEEQPEPALLATVDKGEFIDEAIEYGRPYRYRIQGFAPAGDGEAVSEWSEPAAITPRDTFPPAAPTGLTAIVGAQAIETAWDRSSDFDFAFYRVYRSIDGADPVRLAETGINPSYADRDAQAGKLHRYTVTAVDKRGNESKPSAAAEVRP